MKLLQYVLTLFLDLSLLVGCGSPGPAPVPLDRPAGDPAVVTVDHGAPSPEAFAGFGVELLRACRRAGDNTLVSPLSVGLALGMTANGAQNETLAQFEDLFGMDLDTLNASCVEMLAGYSALGGSTEANLVNSLWADPELTLEDDFVRRCMDLYSASLFRQDLHTPETVSAVNRWVEDATRGMIPSIVDHFDDSAMLALINAVYLKNQFERPFETPLSDWTMNFTAEDDTVSQPLGMSNGTRTEQYIAAENGRGVVLPYDDGRLGLLLMRPDDGVSLSDYLADWNGDTVRTLLNARKDTRVVLTVPKFKVEWSAGLNDILSGMGLTDAFDPDRADFSRMGSAQGYPLHIGSVVHKTAFEVNEKGTAAAAVTMVVMDCASAMPPDDLIYLTFDRSFVYGIVDLENGTPLFLGTLERL